MGAFERIGLPDPARDQSLDDYPRQLGNRLRQLRKQRGLTQRSLAQRLGVSTPALCRWEKGQTLPRKSNILAFANAFNLSEAELLACGSISPEPAASDDGVAAKHASDLAAVSRSSLGELLASCKAMIAEAARTTPERVRIFIEI
jgi:transcriptional regulator with XRE-family HTH domain